ncbi:MAG: DUF2811 domain-containing protein [Cyanobacteriota bacterium]|nr:DUF2811 domain-containing protein [Cyanobacteriota bacterium]
MDCSQDPVNEPEKESQAHDISSGATEPPSSGRLQPPSPATQGLHVSLEAEVPEELFDGMREFINNHPHWDQYSVITSALAGFLFQNGSNDRTVRDHYLAGLFGKP